MRALKRTLIVVALALPAIACKPDSTVLATPGGAKSLAIDPGLVDFHSATANKFVRADTSSELLVRLRVSADALASDARPPINIMLVVDTSGSMEGAAIDDARAAASALVDQLHDGDRFGLVVFHSRAELLVPPVDVAAGGRKKIRSQIERMQARGTTDMAGGVSLALREIQSAMDPKGINRIVLLSDGVPNSAAPMHNLAAQAQGLGVSITALGLGLQFHETLLAQLAQSSGGTFHFIEDSSAVASVFRDEVLHLKRLAASQVSLRLRPGPGVEISEVIGLNVSAGSDRSVQFGLGPLSAGQERDVYVRLAVASHVAGAAVELLDAEVRYVDTVNQSGAHTRELYVAARATTDSGELDGGQDAKFELAAEQASAASSIVQAIALARGGQGDQAKALLYTAQTRAREVAQGHGDPVLHAQAQDMSELLGALPAVQPVASAESGVESGSLEVTFSAEAPAQVRRSHGRALQRLQGSRSMRKARGSSGSSGSR